MKKTHIWKDSIANYALITEEGENQNLKLSPLPISLISYKVFDVASMVENFLSGLVKMERFYAVNDLMHEDFILSYLLLVVIIGILSHNRNLTEKY